MTVGQGTTWMQKGASTLKEASTLKNYLHKDCLRSIASKQTHRIASNWTHERQRLSNSGPDTPGGLSIRRAQKHAASFVLGEGPKRRSHQHAKLLADEENEP